MKVELTPATMGALDHEYGPLTLKRGSLEDLVNALLYQWCVTQGTARRIMEEHTPVQTLD